MAATIPQQDPNALPYASYAFTFHPFPRLPQELRLEILRFALVVRRQIHITCKKALRLRHRFAESFHTTSPLPPLLHVSSECREFALSIYSPYFQTTSSSRAIYANWELDTVCFKDGVVTYIGKEEIQGIQRMKLETKDVLYFAHFNMETIIKMRALRELEVTAIAGNFPSWDSRMSTSFERLRKEFLDEKERDKGWECPTITFVNAETKSIEERVEGGALIPGWTPEIADDHDTPQIII